MHVQFDEGTRSTHRRRRLAVPAAAVLALTLGLAACGDSDDEDAAAPTPTTQAGPDADPAGDTEDVSAFCDAALEVEATFAAGGPEGPDPAQLQTAFEQAQETAPDDIAGDVERLITLTQEAFSGGEESGGPPPPEVEELDANIDEYLLANCDFAEVDVTATEYAFEGLSEPIDAGQSAFNLTNEGGEEHELIVFRVNDDVDMSVPELLELGEAAFSMVEVKGFAMAGPGDSAPAFVDLDAGRYGAVCFFPVGSTPEAVAAAEESGQEIEAPPHFTQGMVAEFTVE